jgi:hypothetical protein
VANPSGTTDVLNHGTADVTASRPEATETVTVKT